ncbi:MAG: hypothetical protein WDW36_005315 [Sanguina aurantia]
MRDATNQAVCEGLRQQLAAESRVSAEAQGALMRLLEQQRAAAAQQQSATELVVEMSNSRTQVDQEMREQLIALRAENQQLGNELKRQARAALTSAAVQAPSGASQQAQAELQVEVEALRLRTKELRVGAMALHRKTQQQREALQLEAERWQLAAHQAAGVAEKAQQQVLALEARLERAASHAAGAAGDVAVRTREATALRAQLEAAKDLLQQREDLLDRLEVGVLGPLNRWYADAHPGSGAGGPAPSTLPRSSGFSALQGKAAVLLGAKAEVNTSAEWQVKVAAAAFEALAKRIAAPAGDPLPPRLTGVPVILPGCLHLPFFSAPSTAGSRALPVPQALAKRIACLQASEERLQVAAREKGAELESRYNTQSSHLRAQMDGHIGTLQAQLQDAGVSRAELREALSLERAQLGVRLQECARLSELASRSQREAEALRSDLERARAVAAQDLQPQPAITATAFAMEQRPSPRAGLAQQEASAAELRLRVESAQERLQLALRGEMERQAVLLLAQVQGRQLALDAACREVALLEARLAESVAAALDMESMTKADTDQKLRQAHDEFESKLGRFLQESAGTLSRDKAWHEEQQSGLKRVADAKLDGERRDAELRLQQQRDQSAQQLERAAGIAEGAVREERSKWEDELRQSGQAAAEHLRVSLEQHVLTWRAEQLDLMTRHEAEKLKLREGVELLQKQLREISGRASAAEELAKMTGSRLTDCQAREQTLLDQVRHVQDELTGSRRSLEGKAALADQLIKENAQVMSGWEHKLHDYRHRVQQQSEQLDKVQERLHAQQGAADSQLEHISKERDSLHAECLELTETLRQGQAAAAGMEAEMEHLQRASDSHRAARDASESAAHDALRSASAAAAATEEQAATCRALRQRLAEHEIQHNGQIQAMQAQRRSQMEIAASTYRAEMEAAHTKLQLIRLKQNRVLAFVDTVMGAEDEGGGGTAW